MNYISSRLLENAFLKKYKFTFISLRTIIQFMYHSLGVLQTADAVCGCFLARYHFNDNRQISITNHIKNELKTMRDVECEY